MALEDLREACLEDVALDGHSQAAPRPEVDGGVRIDPPALSVDGVADAPLPVRDNEPDDE